LRNKKTEWEKSNKEAKGSNELQGHPVIIIIIIIIIIILLWRCDRTLVMASSFLRFPDHTQRRTTVGRTPLDE
jgi:hypothetical protein